MTVSLQDISSRTAVTHSSTETESLGAELARIVRVGSTISLTGPLGAGKTTLIRGLIHALGHKGPVRSPSFTLMYRYRTTPPVSHYDLFRLHDPSELIALGIDEAREDSIVLIEWGDRYTAEWGPPDLSIDIVPTADSDDRTIHIFRSIQA